MFCLCLATMYARSLKRCSRWSSSEKVCNNVYIKRVFEPALVLNWSCFDLGTQTAKKAAA